MCSEQVPSELQPLKIKHNSSLLDHLICNLNSSLEEVWLGALAGKYYRFLFNTIFGDRRSAKMGKHRGNNVGNSHGNNGHGLLQRPGTAPKRPASPGAQLTGSGGSTKGGLGSDFTLGVLTSQGG